MSEDLVGVDYSFSPPSIEAMKAEGVDFAVRYLPFEGDEGKGIRPPELAALHEAGIAVAAVLQRSGNGIQHMGRTNGVTDGRLAQLGLAQLGWPDDRPVYFAVDFDATPENQRLIDGYLAGAAEVLGAERIGVYGGYWVVKRCAENGSAKWFWQTYAWSGENHFAGRHIFQYDNGKSFGGGEVDWNRADGSRDFGAWLPGAIVSQDPDGTLARLARLERIIGGYGIRIGVTESNVDAVRYALGESWPLPVLIGNTLEVTGEDAIRVLDAVQASLHLGLAVTQERIGGHIANHNAGIYGHEHEATIRLK